MKNTLLPPGHHGGFDSDGDEGDDHIVDEIGMTMMVMAMVVVSATM